MASEHEAPSATRLSRMTESLGVVSPGHTGAPTVPVREALIPRPLLQQLRSCEADLSAAIGMLLSAREVLARIQLLSGTNPLDDPSRFSDLLDDLDPLDPKRFHWIEPPAKISERAKGFASSLGLASDHVEKIIATIDAGDESEVELLIKALRSELRGLEKESNRVARECAEAAKDVADALKDCVTRIVVYEGDVGSPESDFRSSSAGRKLEPGGVHDDSAIEHERSALPRPSAGETYQSEKAAQAPERKEHRSNG